MKLKVITGLIVALGFVGSSVAATTTAVGANVATITTTDSSFESVLKLTPLTANNLSLTFASALGGFKSVSYQFFSDASLSAASALGTAITLKTTSATPSDIFQLGSTLSPFRDSTDTSINLAAATTYYLKVDGLLTSTNGALKITTRNGSIAAVPEPESYAMLLAGLGLVGTIARRRNKASKAV